MAYFSYSAHTLCAHSSRGMCLLTGQAQGIDPTAALGELWSRLARGAALTPASLVWLLRTDQKWGKEEGKTNQLSPIKIAQQPLEIIDLNSLSWRMLLCSWFSQFSPSLF